MDDWVRWAIGVFAMIVLSWAGYLQTRIKETERVVGDLARRGELAAAEGDKRLWDALESHKANFQEFRGEMLSGMATKADLRDMEHRLAQLLTPRHS